MIKIARVQTGDFVDGFRLEEELPPSSTAAWWRVSRANDDPSLLMKVPRCERGASLVNFATFEVEQMILRKLSGPYVPRLVTAGTWDNPYLVLESITGGSLCTQLPRPPLPADSVASLGAQIATALHDIHRQRVVHLDIKPSNVMLDQNGKVKIIDFGFSQHLDLPDVFEGQPIGPRCYLAPEQLLGQRTDPRSDIFSLGVMLYFFITGRQPFDASSANRKWRQLHRRVRLKSEIQKLLDFLRDYPAFKRIVGGGRPLAGHDVAVDLADGDFGKQLTRAIGSLYREPMPPRALAPECPVWLQELILRSLEVRPEERHATAIQLAHDLTRPHQVHITSRGERDCVAAH